MVNGAVLKGAVVKIEYLEILNNLIDHNLGLLRNKYNAYINQCFRSFVNNQTQIVMHVDDIFEYCGVLKHLIFVDDNALKINERLFEIFKNITELVIYAGSKGIGDSSRFSLFHLLSSVEKYCKHDLKIMITDHWGCNKRGIRMVSRILSQSIKPS